MKALCSGWSIFGDHFLSNWSILGYQKHRLDKMQLLHSNGVHMPVIKRFSHCRLSINPKDHAPPHFHALMRDGREAWVSISGLEILHGKVPRRELSDVLRWAEDNRSMLLAKFEELQK
jgi:hypothetical protein